MSTRGHPAHPPLCPGPCHSVLAPPTLSWPLLFTSRSGGGGGGGESPALQNFNLKLSLDSTGKPAARESTLRRVLRRLTALNHEAAKCYVNVSAGNIQTKGRLGRGRLSSQLQMTIITAQIQENPPCLPHRPIAQVGLFLAVQ